MGTRVYIGGLPYRVKERDIERFFRGYGKLREVLIKNGYGFVEFEDYRDADDAVYELNGKELCGERVTVERAKGSPRARGRGHSDNGRSPRNGRDHGRSGFRSPRPSGGRGGDNAPPRYGPPTRTDYRLIVENLSSRVSWQDLKDYMRQAGEVTYADAHKQHRNEGVVEFASYSDLKTALDKLDGTDLNGRRIKLVEDKSRTRSRRSRSRSSSRSRSRSRSRRRSRSRSRGSRSKSRSRSKRSGSKSRSRSKSRGRSKSKSRSRSPRKSRSKSRSRSKSHEKSVDRERSKSREKSLDKGRDSRDRMSKSRSRSKSVKSEARSRSRSKSRDKSRSRSRSRSMSRSPSPPGGDDHHDDDDDHMQNGNSRSSAEHDNRDD